MRYAAHLLFLAVPVLDRQCARADTAPPAAATASASSTPVRASSEGPVRVEQLEGSAPPIFVLRGASGPEKLVFLHGMCGHGLGYAQSFQRTAAKYGTLIAPQADVLCDKGPWARWSKDIAALDARITAAFRELGHAEPLRDLVVIGYSQGATRAESLAREYPERYTRLVLMGGPYAAKADGLRALRGAVAMAGDRDRLDLMKASARSLEGAGVPSTFMLIPGAPHGSMGTAPEQTMGEMLAWLFAHQRPASLDAGTPAP